MQFNSLSYVFAFLPIVVLGWALLRRTAYANIFLLLCSLIFYGSSKIWFLFPLFATALLDYWVGQKVHDTQDRRLARALVTLSIVANLGLLAVFKYTTWLTTLISGTPLGAIIPVLIVTLPPAISFYTFQSMSYSIDIYRGEFHPYRNVIDYMSFVAFFPHLVAGPIMRARNLLPQLAKHRPLPEAEQVSFGIFMILFGLFMKTVLADNAGTLVTNVTKSITPDGKLAPGLGLVFAYAFAVQIYCDFAAYTTIARGTAKLFNVELMRNFLTPYLATGPAEFWHRWHISLSTWLRDYLYIPLGGNRGPRWFVIRNLMITMLLGGLWHGAGILFILWGAWHGMLLVLYRYVPIDKWLLKFGRTGKVAAIALFFNLTCIGWIFFRATPDQIGPIWSSIVATPKIFIHVLLHFRPYYLAMASGNQNPITLVGSMVSMLVRQNWVLSVYAWGLVLFGAPVLVMDLLAYRRGCEFHDLFRDMGTLSRAALALALLYGIIFFAQRQANEFIYFAF
jgi:alginate O-acetyltransferase complex protein AlgI